MALPETTELAVPEGAPPEATGAARPPAPAALPNADQATRFYMEQRKYLNQQQSKILADLDARQNNPQETLAAMSKGFLTPTRGGSFGESFGSAIGEMGKVQEDARKRAAELVNMRLALGAQSLASSKEDIGLAKERDAIQLIAKAFGTSPEKVASEISSGNLPSDSISKVTPELMVTVSTLNPKLGEALKSAYSMGVDRVKLIQEDVKSGMTRAEMVAKYGDGVLRFLGSSVPRAEPSQAATTQAFPSPQSPQGMLVVDAPTNEVAEQLAKTLQEANKNNPTPTQFSIRGPASIKPEDIQVDPSLPLAEQNRIRAKITEDRVKATDTAWQEKATAILKYDPPSVITSQANLKELAEIVKKDPKIVGLLQESGWLNAALGATQEGIRVGQYTASIPGVDSMVANLKLTPAQREKLTRVTQILANEFLSNMRMNKGLLGTNPTDNDARLFQAQIANPSQTANSILYWTYHQYNNQTANKDMWDSYGAYTKSRPAGQNPASYFTDPSSGYSKAWEDWGKRYAALTARNNK
jgi:hypothetical protein